MLIVEIQIAARNVCTLLKKLNKKIAMQLDKLFSQKNAWIYVDCVHMQLLQIAQMSLNPPDPPPR